MGRPREHDDDTREQLLVAAGQLLATDGPAALSVRRLADEVGTSTRAIYSLFGSKEGVVREMFVAGFEGLGHAFDEVGRPDDPVEELSALGMAYRRSALDRPHLYAVMFDCPVPEFTPSDADDAFALARLERLRSAVARAVDAGVVVGNDMEITFALWGLVHGLASLELSGVPAGLDADAVWAQALGAMLAGLAPD